MEERYHPYFGKHLLMAVLDLAILPGDIKSRLQAAYSNHLAILSPRNIPEDLQARLDEILDQLKDGALDSLSPEDGSMIASQIFDLWETYERRFRQ